MAGVVDLAHIGESASACSARGFIRHCSGRRAGPIRIRAVKNPVADQPAGEVSRFGRIDFTCGFAVEIEIGSGDGG